MLIRVKFTKEEPVKYLGHLDILRFFQKCFIRAHVKMLYSEGFNPHQKMSFALPLGVGITSRAEYLDAEIEDGQDLLKIKDDLNAVSGSGFHILDVRQVEEAAESLMSVVRFASYNIFPREGDIYIPDEFINSESIEATKKTKKGSRQINIRPMIYEMEGGEKLSLFLSAGSENNLKPELVLEALCAFKNEEYKREYYKIERSGLYGPDRIDLIDYQTCRAKQEN